MKCVMCDKKVPVRAHDKDWRGWRKSLSTGRWICPDCYKNLKEGKRFMCKHKHLLPFHDNSILCLDCDEIIWQDLNGKEYPDKLRARFQVKR